MRHDAPFLVMRLAHPIGRPDQPKRMTIDHHAFTMAAALEWACREQRQAATAPSWRAWLHDSHRWIERNGQPARKTR